MRKVTWLIGIFAIAALLAMLAFVALAQGASLASALGEPQRWLSRLPRQAEALHAAAAAQAAPAVALLEESPAAEDILANALAELEGLDAWHVEMWMDMIASFRTIALDAPIFYSGDYQAPDRMVGKMGIRLLGITLERDTVFKCNTVDGTDAATGPKKCSVFALLDFARFQISDIEDLALVGVEDLDGTQVYHLTGALTTHNTQALTRASPYAYAGELMFDLWVGVDDSLPRTMMVEGELNMTGSAQGTLTLSGGGAWSDFGEPWSEADAAAAEEIVETACNAVGEGFVSFYDPAGAISFCHPDGWVVDDLVDSCGFYAVSPTGVGHGKQVPKTLVSISPPTTVASWGNWSAGAVEVVGQPALCFYGWVRDTLQPGNTGGFVFNLDTVTRIGAWLLSDGPLYSGLTGTEYPGTKAVSLGGTTDGNTNGPTVETIIDSVQVGAAAGP
jgi:hypothetical protein